MVDEPTMIPHSDFHEVWWIYSPEVRREWGGLRIAHFRKTVHGDLVVIIMGEIDTRRVGVRVWEDIQKSELWYKVEQIAIPDTIKVLGMALNTEDVNGRD